MLRDDSSWRFPYMCAFIFICILQIESISKKDDNIVPIGKTAAEVSTSKLSQIKQIVVHLCKYSDMFWR